MNLNCFKLKGKKIHFKKGVSIELLILDCQKDDEENNLMIMKIGSIEIYFVNHNLVIMDDNREEIVVEEKEEEKEELSLYKLRFLKNINGSIEISNERNKGLNCDSVVLYELRVCENDKMTNDYIFSLPFIGKDLISSDDFNIEIIDEIKAVEREVETEMILKENGNIFIYENKYFINKEEMNIKKECGVVINVELSNNLFEIVLSVYIYTYIIIKNRKTP